MVVAMLLVLVCVVVQPPPPAPPAAPAPPPLLAEPLPEPEFPLVPELLPPPVAEPVPPAPPAEQLPVVLSASAVGTANRKATKTRSPPSQIDLSFKVFLLFEHSLGLNCLVLSP